MPESQSTPQPEDPSTYPSLGLAYEFVRPSYEAATRRLDAIESRIRALLTLSATITVAAPVFVGGLMSASGIHRDTGSPFFFLALVMFGILAYLGLASPFRATIMHVSPSELFQKTLHLDEAMFKALILARAGEDFEANRRLIDRQAKTANRMSLLLLMEAAFFAAWAIVPYSWSDLAGFWGALSELLRSTLPPASLMATLTEIDGIFGGGGTGVVSG